jgi:hypothetical protein
MNNVPERREDDPWEQLLQKAGITMEELMAYADGVLGPDRRADVRSALEHHPELMQLLETFLFTKGAFVRPYDELLAKPVPRRLINAARGRRWPSIRELVRGLYAPNPAFRTAMLAVALAAIVLAAWLLRPPLPGNVVILDESGVVPSQPLQRALEGTPSGRLARVAGHLSIRPKLTFYSKQKCWCRQYDLVWDRKMQASALACRDEDGVWRMRVATGAEPVVDGSQPAGEGFLQEARRQIIDGTSLRLAQEEELIGNGWKRRSP